MVIAMLALSFNGEVGDNIPTVHSIEVKENVDDFLGLSCDY